MFAPVVTSGARLAAIRRRLHVLAEEAGFALTYRPVLTALAAGESVSPEIVRDGETRLARFAFPRPVRDIKLISAANRPAETDPGSEDWRALSLCVLPPPGAELGPGWLAPAGGTAGYGWAVSPHSAWRSPGQSGLAAGGGGAELGPATPCRS